jgi:peptidoglycan/LPS O-acetylase OafA/YrhL
MFVAARGPISLGRVQDLARRIDGRGSCFALSCVDFFEERLSLLDSHRPKRPPRIDALTGLRILAAIIVVLSHLKAPANAPVAMATFFAAGYAGVTVFFILSGFVLCHNYFDSFADGFTLRTLCSFAVARVARVYPLYLLILLWCAAPAIAAGDPMPYFLRNVLAIQTWSPDLGAVIAYNGPGWSIGVEFFLYASFPLLVFALRPFSRNLLGVVGAMVAVELLVAGASLWFVRTGRGALPWADPHSAHRWLYRGPLFRLGDFCLGMLTSHLVRRLAGRPAARLIGLPALVMGATSILVLMSWPGQLFSAPSWDASYTLPTVMLIVGLALTPRGLATRALASAPFVLLGEASYALYLCHGKMLPLAIVAPLGAPWVLAIAMNLLVPTATAVGFHVLVERPTRRWLRTLISPARSGALARSELSSDVTGSVPTT